jgi:hypothetical protein
MNATGKANTPRFAMLELKETERVTELVGKRDLQLRDVAVIWVLLSHTSSYSGRIQVTAAGIAHDLQVQDSEIRASLARLKKHHLLRQIKDRNTGECYYRLNPWMVLTNSGGSLFGLACKEFGEA